MTRHFINEIFRPRTIVQFLITGVAGFWLVLSLSQETFQVFYHVPWRQKLIAQYFFTVSLNFAGTVLPLLLLLVLFRSVIRHRKAQGKQPSLYRLVLAELHGNAGIFLFLFILIAPIYLFLEEQAAISVTPLVTPLCAILGISFGYYLVRDLHIKDRFAILALLSALVLGTKYVDWNPIKALARDMFRLEAGMTFDEVDKIMSNHKHPRGGESYNDFKVASEEIDEAVYMPPTTADMVTVRFQDGTVTAINFSHD